MKYSISITEYYETLQNFNVIKPFCFWIKQDENSKWSQNIGFQLFECLKNWLISDWK